MKRVKMNRRSQIKAKKLAVLKIINENKDILFGSTVQNNSVTRKQKEEAWLVVLKEAQYLGLTSGNRQWNYARDHLFGLWKSRTLAKRDYLNKTTTDSGRVLDEVDKKILEIVEKDSSSDSIGLELPETDITCFEKIEEKPILLLEPSFEHQQKQEEEEETNKEKRHQEQYQQQEQIHQQNQQQQYQHEQHQHQQRIHIQRKRTSCMDTLKKEVLESELYINKLKILKLEKELGLPLSKFTLEFKHCNFK